MGDFLTNFWLIKEKYQKQHGNKSKVILVGKYLYLKTGKLRLQYIVLLIQTPKLTLDINFKSLHKNITKVNVVIFPVSNSLIGVLQKGYGRDLVKEVGYWRS